MTTQSWCRSPNVLSLGDTLWLSLWGYGRLYHPGTEFLVRVVGFTGQDVHVESVDHDAGPYGDIETEWTVPFSWLRRERPDLAADLETINEAAKRVPTGVDVLAELMRRSDRG